MSRVFWDTNLFVYLLEGRGSEARRVVELRERMLQRNDQLLTSTLTLGEILVKPLEEGNDRLRQRYEDTFVRTVVLVPFDREAALAYARIRHDRSIRAPDAVQLACAARAQADLFITNDDRLARRAVPGVQFVASLAQAFL